MKREELRDNIDGVLSEMFKIGFINKYLRFIEGEGAVLYILAKNPDGIIPSEISDLLQVSRARVTSILNSLKIKDLVFLKHDDLDRRKTYVLMTEKGCDLVAKLINERIYLFDFLYEKIGGEKMNSFYELLTSTLETLKLFEEEGDCDE